MEETTGKESEQDVEVFVDESLEMALGESEEEGQEERDPHGVQFRLPMIVSNWTATSITTANLDPLP
jgi:hypothetical protein